MGACDLAFVSRQRENHFLILYVGEICDGLDELLDARQTGSGERLPLQNVKSDFDLVEPTCRSGSGVKMNLWIGCPQDVIFLVRAQVVENDIELSPLRQFCDNFVHIRLKISAFLVVVVLP